jgi:IclR family transcriptional regulator, mhp operon transcriptional activator
LSTRGPFKLRAATTPQHVQSQSDLNSLVLGLSKGLRVLALLNLRDDMSVAELNLETGIPRPTVHRLLNTLMTEGAVTTGLRRGRYRVAIGARKLSEGYKEPDWLTDVAAPVMDRLQKRVIWPSDLATYSYGSMVIRRTTNHLSPLSIVERHVGARLSMLRSALGLAYLAACPEDVRNMILETVANSPHPDSRIALDRPKMSQLLDCIGARGYATRDGGAAPRSLALAVPVVAGDTPVGALNVLLYRSAVSVKKAELEVLPHLAEAAQDLGRRFATQKSDASTL